MLLEQLTGGKMRNIVIFGGTTEGRELVERLIKNEQLNIYVCVATSYGAELLPKCKELHIEIGRMDQLAMEKFFKDIHPEMCVDATHPYATEVTENIINACKNTEVRYLRVLREETEISSGEKFIYCGSVDEAVEFLKDKTGVIFASTGSKELHKYTAIPDFRNRLVARVLPTQEVLDICKDLGLEETNIIAKQGPFSIEENYQDFLRVKAKWLVTKSTGKAGGFAEKCEAALQADMNILVVGRPKEVSENTVSVEDAMQIVLQMIG